MPIYAFECTDCSHASDRLQKLSDPDPETCPACGKTTIKRQLTAPAFRLAGSGWYETDFKKDGEKKRNLAGADAKTGTDQPAATPKTDAPKKVEATPAAGPPYRPGRPRRPHPRRAADPSATPGRGPAASAGILFRRLHIRQQLDRRRRRPQHHVESGRMRILA